MKIEEIIKLLIRSGLRIFTIQDLKKLLEIKLDNTIYKVVEKLIKKEILIFLKKGVYGFGFSPPKDFEIANSLYSPSYISLESALSFYGILMQFPYATTSITPRKTKKFEVSGKEFEYIHIRNELFWGYRKEKRFLIAHPEKALTDEIYIMAKGWRKIDFTELDYSKLNVQRLKKMARKIGYPPFQKLFMELSKNLG